MSIINSGYDLSSLTYSPEGRLLQIEYVAKFISQSKLTMGLVCEDGLLIVSEKFQNDDIIFEINKNVCIGSSGYLGDFYFILKKIKSDSKNYLKFFSDFLTGKTMVMRICIFLHMYTFFWHLRPLACSLILGTICFDFFELYLVLFSGFFIKCFANAIGINSDLIKLRLEFLVSKLSPCRKNIQIISHILRKFQKKEGEINLSISWFVKENFFFETFLPYNLSKENQRLRVF